MYILRNYLSFAMLCNHANLITEKKNDYKLDGDPTEGALLVAGYEGRLYKRKFTERIYHYSGVSV